LNTQEFFEVKATTSFGGCTRIYGSVDKEYDLDNPDHLKELGLANDNKHADGYCHFTNCFWMVEERKGANQVKIALEQIESTVSQLTENKRKVTHTVIIMRKLSRAEQKRFFVDPKTHELRNKDSARGIRIEGVQETVKVFYHHELSRVIAELRGFDWASVSH